MAKPVWLPDLARVGMPVSGAPGLAAGAGRCSGFWPFAKPFEVRGGVFIAPDGLGMPPPGAGSLVDGRPNLGRAEPRLPGPFEALELVPSMAVEVCFCGC